MTSETNPESGTTSFTFDTDSTCNSTSDGDLVKRVDANGNVTCYTYDPAHRVTQISYPSGPNSGVTPTKTFIYDSDANAAISAVSGYPATNLIGRLVEAYTGPGTQTEPTIGYAYDSAGRPDYTAEATPDSGGWITATESYHRGGAVEAIAAEGVPQMNYGLDGEGRPATALDANGYHDVSAGNYAISGSSLTLNLTLGTGDTDAYTYDAATGAMTQYQLTVNGAADTGTLGWHKDGEAKSFSIADSIPGSNDNGVSCAYAHDDLGRLSEANCGSADDEQFGWDPFGDRNTSTGPSQLITNFSFTTNNQISTSTGGAYDSDGNLLHDPFNTGVTNTFDAEGRPVDLLGMTVTYDALGRELEVAWGPHQILYAPDGTKLGLMNGSSAYAIDYALPGGGAAVYNASGLQFFRHAGALGSAALTTNLSRALLSSDYYSPFGFDESGAGPGYRSFTGQKQLTDSLHSGGQYDFLHREYNPIQGRWWTPDPAGLAAVDPNNPQTWNAYAYVAGTPLEATDPLGLNPVDNGDGSPLCMVNPFDPSCGWNYLDIGIPAFALASDWGGGDPTGSAGGWGGAAPVPGAAGAPANPPGSAAPGGVGAQEFYGTDGLYPTEFLAWERALLRKLSDVWWTLGFSDNLAGVGYAVSIDLNPVAGIACVGAGPAATEGRSVTAGPVVVFNGAGIESPNQAKKVFSGWSWTFGWNGSDGDAPVGPGVQAGGNENGHYWGPTFGVVGKTLAVTYSWCKGGGK